VASYRQPTRARILLTAPHKVKRFAAPRGLNASVSFIMLSQFPRLRFITPFDERTQIAMRIGLVGGAALVVIVVAASIGHADVVTFARGGPWEAFGGTSNDGQKMCGVSTSWKDDRYFALKYFKGDKTLTLQLGSPDWQIKNGAEQRVSLQIDQNGMWSGNAKGMHFSNGQAGLQFEINVTELKDFIAEFREGDQLFLSFPGSNASDWTANLEGTDTISTSLANCVDAL
jgi:hypothetical protein